MSEADQSVGGTPSTVPVGHDGVRVEIDERTVPMRNGWAALGGATLLLALSAGAFIGIGLVDPVALKALLAVTGSILSILSILVYSALTIVNPGQTKVVQFFGRYIGTVRRTGLVLTPLLSSRKTVSVRVRNFETSALKVNDADGNPVNIGAIVVWQVADTARATFAVEDYANFVRVQSEAALRHVATTHPYDNADDGEATLRGSTDQVSAELAHEVAERVALAGVEIIEARISHLAYAPEIAQAMLQRQQAGAIIAAREKIVEGAVGMVETALERLERDSIVALDDERRAAMVSNLLVVLCGDSRATPIVNTGSLYS